MDGGLRHEEEAPEGGLDYLVTVELTPEEAAQGCRKAYEAGPLQGHLTLPAGVTDGQEFRVRGAGAPGPDGGPAGDLIVTVSVPDMAFDFDDSEALDIDWELAMSLPRWALLKHTAMPLRRDADGTLVLAVADPMDSATVVRLRRALGPVRVVAAPDEAIRAALDRLSASTTSPATMTQQAAGGLSQLNMPNTYLGWALGGFLCGCGQFLALLALIQSGQVSARWNAGDAWGAELASEKARRLVYAAYIIGILTMPFVLYLQLAPYFRPFMQP
jgi:hypothetical protein